MPTVLFFVLLLWLIYLLFATHIKRWLMKRVLNHMARSFGRQPDPESSKRGKNQGETPRSNSIEEKVDPGTIAKRKFGKNQGEYVDFEDIDSSKQ